ncbi:MAG TPA: MFS transporter [Haliscomenobacter sp.]|uniref:MFS transporter n=1 Tax=Haliscomenobacter sp. TaxID=2717303 RepID=UPI002C59275A|nr:MFS transporter [Haliscomenobacter sp.]HOY20161.1 MFS transporter [Haliscomenobacter sp.]
MNGNYRWRIVALLFLATTINYVDRQVLSFVMTDDLFRKTILGLSPEVVFSEQNMQDFRIQMGWIDSAFKATYALGFLLVGWLIDKIGTKKGFTIGIFIWSIASVLSTFCASAGQFKIVRALLGLGESTNFPSAMKAISVWFPKAERSTATGILNAGSNMGIIVTAVLIPFLVVQYGWRASFFISALLGILMLLIWYFSYSEPEETPALSAKEYHYITGNMRGEKAEALEPQLSWGQLLRYRQTWAFIFGKIFADPVWFFYLTWLPDFLSTNQQLDRKLDLKNFGVPFLIIYLVSDLGSIFFGWLATRLMQKGWTENAARKLTLLICGSLVLPIWFIPTIHSFNLIVAMFALAMAAHQGWSTNVYALATTLFPKNSVGSATGLGGFLGGSISMAVAAATGYVVAYLGYTPMFIFACSFYLIGLVCMHLTLPVLTKIELK